MVPCCLGKGASLRPGCAFPYCTLQLGYSQSHHLDPAMDVVPPPHPSSGSCRDGSRRNLHNIFVTPPSAPQKPSLETFTPSFLSLPPRILSQALTEAYFSAEESSAGCVPHHPFLSASWPQSINSLWKAAGLRTLSPRSTWLKPLNDQLGMSHVSSPSPGNLARSLCTGLK